MTDYAVEITNSTEDAIYAQAHYIAVEKQEPLSAVQWLQSTFDAVLKLKTFPKRCSLAEENRFS